MERDGEKEGIGGEDHSGTITPFARKFRILQPYIIRLHHTVYLQPSSFLSLPLPSSAIHNKSQHLRAA